MNFKYLLSIIATTTAVFGKTITIENKNIDNNNIDLENISNDALQKAFNLPDNDLSNEIFERIRNNAMNANAANMDVNDVKKHQKRSLHEYFYCLINDCEGNDNKCLMAGGPNGRHSCCNFNCNNDKEECRDSCWITRHLHGCVKC